MALVSWSENTFTTAIAAIKLTFGFNDHPLVVQNLVNGQPLGRVFLQNSFQQLKCFLGHRVSTIFVVWLLLDYLFVKFNHAWSFKRHAAEQHCVENNSCRPDVGLIPSVASVLKHFWRYVSWRSTLFEHKFGFLSNELAHAEVTNFNVALRSEEDVVQFYVTMKHVFLMTITEASYYLPEQMSCCVFLQLSTLSHVG